MIDFKKEVYQIQDDLIADIQTVARIPSVLDEASAKEGQPFGEECRRALDAMLEIGRRDGFAVKDVDGYAGHIDIGEGDEVIGVLGHLDVVPVNATGWNVPPFSATLKDGVLYGRGVQDDKGPLLAAYHAAKLIHDMKLPLRRKIRIIFGCDEESGSRCMAHYFTKEPYPKWAFTPDAFFPVCYGEKAPCGIRISGRAKSEELISFHAGDRPNIVPQQAKAVIKNMDVEESLKAYCEKYGLRYELKNKGDNLEITLTGKSAHASMPELGKNAAVYLAGYLNTVISHPVTKFVDEYFQDDVHAKKLGFYHKGAMGELTCNLGIIDYEDEKLEITLDCRCPHEMDFDTVTTSLEKILTPYGWSEQHFAGKALFVDPQSELITTLHEAYVSLSGDVNAKPMTMGGGTYAKTMPNNCVAFGMEFPNCDNHIHEDNEILKIDDLMLGCAIYAKAIYDLAR